MKKTSSQYPEIDSLNLGEVHEAINLGNLNLGTMTAEHRPETERRLRALEERRMHLIRSNRAKSPRKKKTAATPAQ